MTQPAAPENKGASRRTQRRGALPAVAMLLMLGLFAWGIVALFQLRFSAGDIYPEYSSLRTDPLGAKAYRDSLALLPHLSVRAGFDSLERLATEPPDMTLLVLGADVKSRWPRAIDSFVRAGGRAVFCFRKWERETEFDLEEMDVERTVSLRDWGISWEVSYEESDSAEPAENSSALPWHVMWLGNLVFTSLDEEWRVIYERDGEPVLVERNLDAGSLVMAADSYFVSNESLWREPQSELLAWLVGPSRRVLFHETHLGLSEDPGVVTLIHRYRLAGVMAALAVLVALFLWRAAMPFMPPVDRGTAHVVAGKDATTAFVNLLRRNIRERDILGVCIAEWKKDVHRLLRAGSAPSRVARAQLVMSDKEGGPQRARSPAVAYEAIRSALTGKGPWKHSNA